MHWGTALDASLVSASSAERLIRRCSIITVYEDLTLAVIFLLAAAATAAIYLGLAGMLGRTRWVRCAACNHWTFSPANEPRCCPYCRHPLLLHPVHAIFHPRRHASEVPSHK
jgi:hypothetical protein